MKPSHVVLALFATVMLALFTACSGGGQATTATRPTLLPTVAPLPTVARLPTVAPLATVPSQATSTDQIPKSSPTESGNGSVLFQDDFSDPKSGWSELKLDCCQFDYHDGAYRSILNTANDNISSVLPKHDFDNASVEVDITRLSGPDDAIFGIVCRATEDSLLRTGYKFVITPSGAYGIVKQTGSEGGQFKILGESAKSSAIQTGGATNRVRADCDGNNLTLYVNGQKLVSAEDSDYKNGQVGFVVSTQPDAGGLQVAFDNFVVRRPSP